MSSTRRAVSILRPVQFEATAADLGLNRLSTILLAIQAVALVVIGLLFLSLGLSADWTTLAGRGIGIGIVGLVWLYYYCESGRRNEWVIAEALFVLLLTMMLALIVASGQYVVASLRRPLIDSWLAAVDAGFGVSVPQLVAWTRPHTAVTEFLRFAYFTLVPQFLLTVVIVGLILRDRQRLWEYAFHFHFCALLTLAVFAIFPAASAFTHYGFESLIDQGRFIRHFQGLQAGTLSVIPFDEMEGLVSFPSFHVAGALIVTWAFREYRRFLWPLMALNASLIAATVMTGAHYVTDILATLVMFAASLFTYRHIGLASLFEVGPARTKGSERLAGFGESFGRGQITEAARSSESAAS